MAVAFLCIFLLLICSGLARSNPGGSNDWATFLSRNSNQTNQSEISQRLSNTHRAVEQLTLKHPLTRFSSHGPFALLSSDEWKKRGSGVVEGGGIEGLDPITFTNAEISAALSTSVDWQTGNNFLSLRAVTRVKNQGLCGSCWAFSTIGALEAAWAIGGNQLTAFSEQYILDCISNQYLAGCGGGSTQVLAGLLAVDSKSVPMERDYEYEAYNKDTESCRSSILGVGSASAAYQVVARDGQNQEDAMAAYIHLHGPLIASVATSDNNWQLYASGILQCKEDTSSSDLDHGILIVGYGVKDNIPYWRIKNSWTPLWGDSGYALLQRGNKDCGIQFTPLGLKS